MNGWEALEGGNGDNESKKVEAKMEVNSMSTESCGG